MIDDVFTVSYRALWLACLIVGRGTNIDEIEARPNPLLASPIWPDLVHIFDSIGIDDPGTNILQ